MSVSWDMGRKGKHGHGYFSGKMGNINRRSPETVDRPAGPGGSRHRAPLVVDKAFPKADYMRKRRSAELD